MSSETDQFCPLEGHLKTRYRGLESALLGVLHWRVRPLLQQETLFYAYRLSRHIRDYVGAVERLIMRSTDRREETYIYIVELLLVGG